jgi:hypothetical protein
MNYIFYSHNFNKNSGGSSLFYILLNNLNYDNFYIAPVFCRGDGLIDEKFIDYNNLDKNKYNLDIHSRTLFLIDDLPDTYFNQNNYDWPEEYKKFLIKKDILLNRNNVAVYTEGFLGNPLQQKFIWRWILYFPTPGLPCCPYFPWSKKDKFIFWIKSYYKNKDIFYKGINDGIIYNTEYYPIEDEILYLKFLFLHKNIDLNFKNKNQNRNGSCYLVRKADINYNRTFSKNWNFGENYNQYHAYMKPKPPIFIHPVDSICIDSYGLDDLIKIFQKKEFFYCYDLYTFHNSIAILYGCKVIMGIPDCNLTKEEWHCNDNTYLDYMAWGNLEEQIIKSELELSKVNYGNILKKNENECINNFINIYNELEKYYDDIKNNYYEKILNELIFNGTNYITFNIDEEYNNKNYTKNYSSNFWKINIEFIIYENNLPYANLFDMNFNRINYGPRLEYNNNTISLIIGNYNFFKGILIDNNIQINILYNLNIELESNKLTINYNNNKNIYNLFILPNWFEKIIIGKGFNDERYFNGLIKKFELVIY